MAAETFCACEAQRRWAASRGGALRSLLSVPSSRVGGRSQSRLRLCSKRWQSDCRTVRDGTATAFNRAVMKGRMQHLQQSGVHTVVGPMTTCGCGRALALLFALSRVTLCACVSHLTHVFLFIIVLRYPLITTDTSIVCMSLLQSLYSLRLTPLFLSSHLFTMDVLECVPIKLPEDAALLQRFYNELMIPNFPLKEVGGRETLSDGTEVAQYAPVHWLTRFCYSALLLSL
jgi:hypothetical protein